MRKTIRWLFMTALILSVCNAVLVFAEPLPQDIATPAPSQSPQVSSDSQNQQAPATDSIRPDPSITPAGSELPDAPSPAQSSQQGPGDSSSKQQVPPVVPSGTATAKAPTVKGAPASRTVGAAIAPARQHQRRSLVLKVGLIAGACVAAGSAFALSKGSPSKPPGAP